MSFFKFLKPRPQEEVIPDYKADNSKDRVIRSLREANNELQAEVDRLNKELRIIRVTSKDQIAELQSNLQAKLDATHKAGYIEGLKRQYEFVEAQFREAREESIH